MRDMLTMIAGWALAVFLSYLLLAGVGVAAKVMYLAFMTGWRWL